MCSWASLCTQGRCHVGTGLSLLVSVKLNWKSHSAHTHLLQLCALIFVVTVWGRCTYRCDGHIVCMFLSRPIKLSIKVLSTDLVPHFLLWPFMQPPLSISFCVHPRPWAMGRRVSGAIGGEAVVGRSGREGARERMVRHCIKWKHVESCQSEIKFRMHLLVSQSQKRLLGLYNWMQNRFQKNESILTLRTERVIQAEQFVGSCMDHVLGDWTWLGTCIKGNVYWNRELH